VAGIAAKPNEDRPMAGILLMLAAYLTFSCIDTSSKWLGVLGLSALQLSFMRYCGHFIITIFLIGRGGFQPARFLSDNPGLVIIRSLLLMGSTVLNFFAIRYLPLTLTSTILFSAPIIVCALSWPLLGERVGLWRWGAIFIGFAGIMVTIRPFDENFHWAAMLSMCAAFCFALYVILTRKLSGVVAADTMQFYSGLVGTFVLLPFAIVEWQNPATGFQWLVLVMLGFFGWFGHQLLINAHGYAPASMLTPFGYSFILYLTIWSYFVFEHIPDFWTLAGAAIIISAGMIIWWRERQRYRTPAHAD